MLKYAEADFAVARFVIWGAGKVGRSLVNILGTKRIVAFIDSNTKLIDTNYKGIRVISYNKYREEFIQYPIIISAKLAEKEILSFLQHEGIEWAFPFSQCSTALLGFLRQAPVGELISTLDKKREIYIYGFCPLGLLIFDFLVDNGYKCRILLQSDTSELLQQYLNRKTGVKVNNFPDLSDSHNILLAMKVNKSDEARLKQLDTESWYDLGEKDLYYNPRIEKLRGIHKGERCFVVATGPSLIVEDLNVLHKTEEICFSVNGIFKIFEKTQWRPDYYFLSDLSGMLSWRKDILEMDVKAKFISDLAWDFKEDEINENMYKWHLQFTYPGMEPGFSEDFARRSFCGMTVVYDGPLQLATYMGFREIYMIGTDCCQYDDPQKQHFMSDYSTEKSYMKIDEMLVAYQVAKKYADTHGIKIYNATRGGNLEIFERVDFDKLF